MLRQHVPIKIDTCSIIINKRWDVFSSDKPRFNTRKLTVKLTQSSILQNRRSIRKSRIRLLDTWNHILQNTYVLLATVAHVTIIWWHPLTGPQSPSSGLPWIPMSSAMSKWSQSLSVMPRSHWTHIYIRTHCRSSNGAPWPPSKKQVVT